MLSVIDYKSKTIPNRGLLYMLVLWAVIVGGTIIVDREQGLSIVWLSLFGAGFAGVTFGFCYLVTKGQLGIGDIKFSLVLGLYLTSEHIFGAVAYVAILCFVYSLIQIARKRLTMKDSVPFLPFLQVGICMAIAVV